MKKVISLFLSIVMLLSITAGIDLSAYAASYSGTCGDNLTWSFDTDTGVLTIDGSGDMTDYFDSEKIPWYSYRYYIKTATISNGVTSISDYAFFECTNLTSVTIGDSVTSIGQAFFWCTSLTSITIPDSVTSISDYAFTVTALKSIDVDSNNTCYSSQDGLLFNKDKTKLIKCPEKNEMTSYEIPNSVTSIGTFAFESCYKLTSITIPDSVTNIEYSAFIYCDGLTSITIPANIEDEAFVSCDNLESVTICDSVTSIGNHVFSECTSLTSIIVDDNNEYFSSLNGVLFNKDKTKLVCYPEGKVATSYEIPGSVTSIGEYAFYWCTSIISLTIPDSVTNIGECAFWYCTGLTNVTIGNSATSIGEWAFFGCTSLTDVYYGGTIAEWNSISIGYFNDDLLNATIHCTDGDTTGQDTSDTDQTNNIIYTTTVTISSGGECQYIYFTPTESGSYTFASSGSYDTYGYLYDENMNLLSSNDDGESDSNFSITYDLETGTTYILGCRFYSSSTTGSFDVSLVLNESHTHSYDDGVVTKAATCSETGIKTYTCTECGETYTESISSTGHSYNSGTVTKAATCSATGVKTYTCTVCGATKTETIAKTAHTYDSGKVTKAATCTSTGVKTYTCKSCGATKTETIAKTAHTYKNVVTKATLSKSGKITPTCSVCGATKSATTIYYPKTIKLSSTSYTYDGDKHKPSVTVKDSKGNKISSSNYTVTYSNSKSKSVGKYTVTIKFKGNYSGTKTLTYTIKPKSTSISKITAKSKGFTVKWKKQATQTTGYQIQYSTSSKFSNAKTVTISKTGTTSKTISKLKSKKKYYVRVRTYKTVKVNGKSTKIYSSWSKSKTVTTKK